MPTPIVEITGLKNKLGGQWVHTDINLAVTKGEILGIIGGSGSGKTTLLRSIMMLLKPTSGKIQLFGQDIANLSESEESTLCRRFGVLFQHSALFSGMTVLDNVMFPMKECANLPIALMQQLALLKIILVGLPITAAHKYPAELSGGMQRRAAAARAIAMDPELLFLDEPTSGLDPLSAKQLDHLIVFLRNTLNLTILIVSHDISSLQRTTNRVAFIGEGKIIQVAPIDVLMQDTHPLIVEYFQQIEIG